MKNLKPTENPGSPERTPTQASNKCPTCASTDRAKRGTIEMEWDGGTGRINLHRERWGCRDPWHDVAERDWRKMCIVEIAAENQSVAEYVEHWEGRALKAEKSLAEAAPLPAEVVTPTEEIRVAFEGRKQVHVFIYRPGVNPQTIWRGSNEELAAKLTNEACGSTPESEPYCETCDTNDCECVKVNLPVAAPECVSAPTDDQFEAAWKEYNAKGNAGGWERVAFISGFGKGFSAALKPEAAPAIESAPSAEELAEQFQAAYEKLTGVEQFVFLKRTEALRRASTREGR